MRLATLALILFGAVNAYALGPIPNGTYAGNIKCSGQAGEEKTIIVNDTTMSWDEQKREFTAGASGYFTIRSVTGVAGSGHGYFTPYGLHYDFTFELPPAAGARKTIPLTWEGTYVYGGGTLYFLASSDGPSGKIKCGGSFSPKH
ncbi:MAG TPA: hypothetical protein VNK24_10690 [Elusimicrobiota bacterium]|nr:hypothetical protein [Elusimicrobiota bacterium]